MFVIGLDLNHSLETAVGEVWFCSWHIFSQAGHHFLLERKNRHRMSEIVSLCYFKNQYHCGGGCGVSWSEGWWIDPWLFQSTCWILEPGWGAHNKQLLGICAEVGSVPVLQVIRVTSELTAYLLICASWHRLRPNPASTPNSISGRRRIIRILTVSRLESKLKSTDLKGFLWQFF